MDGQNTVLSVVGPLSHSVASLRLVVKSLLNQQPWLHDPSCNEIPWRQDQENETFDLISSSKLAFGILKHDGAITPHPPVHRALDIVVETLQRLGHEVVYPKQSAINHHGLTQSRSLNGILHPTVAAMTLS